MAARGKLTPLKIDQRQFYLKGTAPLMVHRFASKAMHEMLAKMMGLPVGKEPREPEMDYVRSLYLMQNDRFGFPCSAFKRAIVRGAKATQAMAMTDARSAFYILGEMTPTALGTRDLVEIVGVPTMHADIARNDNGGADFRFRAIFDEWSVLLRCDLNRALITDEQLGQMILAAGYGVGIGEYRREKGENMGSWTLGTAQEHAALLKRSGAGQKAWFAEHGERIQRVQTEDRRLMELILTNPKARDAAEKIIRKQKANGTEAEMGAEA